MLKYDKQDQQGNVVFNERKVENVPKQIKSEVNTLKEQTGKANQELISKCGTLERVVRGLKLEVKSFRTKQDQSVTCKYRKMFYTVTAAGLKMLEGWMEKGNLLQQAMISSGLEQIVVFDVNLKSVASNETERAEGRIVCPNQEADFQFILNKSVQDDNMDTDGDLYATKMILTNSGNEQGDFTANRTDTATKMFNQGNRRSKWFKSSPRQRNHIPPLKSCLRA
jgi:hypothetical protein